MTGKDEMARRLVSLDWALKRLLRSKANFGVLEGFLSELLGTSVVILEVLESESNRETANDRQNRVDIKVRLESGEIVIIEVQAYREPGWYGRMLYGTSKVVTEHLRMGEPYEKVVRVISVSILYVPLGEGGDYVYRGRTEFRGVHAGEILRPRPSEQQGAGRGAVGDFFPEYWVIRVDSFDGLAKTPLDQWIYFLKTHEIPDDFTARGLDEARKILDVMNLSEDERLSYDLDMMAQWKLEGQMRGEREAGRAEERLSIARRLLARMTDAEVAATTGLPVDVVAALRAT